jgi:hypothetical protein
MTLIEIHYNAYHKAAQEAKAIKQEMKDIRTAWEAATHHIPRAKTGTFDERFAADLAAGRTVIAPYKAALADAEARLAQAEATADAEFALWQQLEDEGE